MKPVVNIQSTDTGATLTTFIYCGIWQCWAAEQMGKIGYINWPGYCKPPRHLEAYYDKEKFKEIPNMFEWYFHQPFVDRVLPTDEVWTWQNCPEAGMYPLMSQPLEVIREYYQENLRFNAHVNAAGTLIRAKYGIDFDKTIGVTWRGTDNVTDGRPRIPIEAYYPYIDRILMNNPDLRIACTAEEEGILEPLLKRYKNAFIIEEFFSSPLGSLQNPERFSPFTGYQRGMQPALMVWLFSKCAYYIKNRSSTGAVASWLSNGKIVCIAHAETLNYDKLDDQVEFQGKRYMLYGNIIPDL